MNSKNTPIVDCAPRDPAPDLNAMFYQRWSPRHFEKTHIPEQTLTAIFDAARWAPSCYNDQPWLFITNDGEKDFDDFLNLLVDANKTWACNASVLGFVVARKNFDLKEGVNMYGPFDCGAAWMSLTLQARLFGLYTHGMGGIKRELVYDALHIPRATHTVVCGFAIGALAKSAPDNKLSTRHPLKTIWRTARF